MEVGREGAAGFTRNELLVVVAGVFLLSWTVPSLLDGNGAVTLANLTAVSMRGKDVWGAVTQAEAERREGTLWPSDGMGFADSTAYFRWLVEEERVEGLDYRMLAGAGVPVCTDGRLTAEQNMWTVAQNAQGLGEMWPVLVTRNVDALSLATPETVTNGAQRLWFDDMWETPFGEVGLALVRKGGAGLRMRRKYMDYGTVYLKEEGKGVGRVADSAGGAPLRYLTPVMAVSPGEAAYERGVAARARRMVRLSWRFREEARLMASMGVPVVVFCGLIYGAVLGMRMAGRRREGRSVRFSARRGMVAGLRFAAVCLCLLTVLVVGNVICVRFPVFTVTLAVVALVASEMLERERIGD